MTDPGILKSERDQNIIPGKEIGIFGKNITCKEKAFARVKVNEGSETVYKDVQGNWHLNELKEENLIAKSFSSSGIAGVALAAATLSRIVNNNISIADKTDLSFYPVKIKKAGKNNPVISLVGEKTDKLSKIKFASDPNTSINILQELSYDPDPEIRIKVLENPRISTELLMEMSIDTDPFVRAAVVNNPKTTTGLLHEMSDDYSFQVKLALAGNKNTPKDILRKISTDKYEYGTSPMNDIGGYDNAIKLFKTLKANKSKPSNLTKVIKETLKNLIEKRNANRYLARTFYKNPGLSDSKIKAFINSLKND